MIQLLPVLEGWDVYANDNEAGHQRQDMSPRLLRSTAQRMQGFQHQQDGKDAYTRQLVRSCVGYEYSEEYARQNAPQVQAVFEDEWSEELSSSQEEDEEDEWA